MDVPVTHATPSTNHPDCAGRSFRKIVTSKDTKTLFETRPFGKSPRRADRPSEVRAQRSQSDPGRSEPREPDKTQCGQRPREVRQTQRVRAQRARQEPKEATQTQRGQRPPKGPGEHRRCWAAFLIHRGVNPGGANAPVVNPKTEPVQPAVFLGWSRSPAVFCDPLTRTVWRGLGGLALPGRSSV